MPWLYCLEMVLCRRDCPEKKIYKFGKTNKPDPIKILNAYNGMNKIAKILVINHVENADLIERKILEELKNKFEFLLDIGREWFYCDNEDELFYFIKDLEKKYHKYEETDEDEEDESITTSIKPNNFTLNGVTYPIPNLTWRSLTIEVIRKVYAISGLSQREFEQKLLNNNNKKFSINDDTMRSPHSCRRVILDNSNVYIELHGSRNEHIKTCQKIASLFQVDFEFTTNET